MLYCIFIINHSNNVYIAETYKQIMRENCSIYGISIENDSSDKRIARTIQKLTLNDLFKSTFVMPFFNEKTNGDFRNFLYSRLKETDLNKLNINTPGDLTNENISKINLNTLYSAVKDYYRLVVKDIDNYNSTENNNALNGFTSHQAYQEAKNYIASKIIEVYYATKSKENIKETINTYIRNTFVRDFVYPLATEFSQYSSNEGYSKNSIDYAKSYIDIFNKRNKLINERNNKFKFYKTNKTSKDKTVIDEVKQVVKQINELDKEIANLKTEIVKYVDLFLQSVPSSYTAYKNYYNLYKIITGENVNKFYEEVFNSKRLIQVNDLFDTLTEEQKVYKQENNDDENSFKEYDNDQYIDETAKSWDNKLLDSYQKNIAGDVKLYFGSFYDIESPFSEGQTEFSYKTSPYLGTRKSISSEFLIKQLSTKIKFNGPESFVEQVKQLAQSVPELYCLAKLYNDIKKDIVFRNRIYHELSQNRFIKTQTVIGEEKVEVKVTNEASNEISQLLYESVNSIKACYNDIYDESDKIILNKLIINSDATFLNKTLKNNAITQIIKIANKYLPNIPSEYLENYFNRATLTPKEFSDIIKNFNELLNQVKKLKIQRQTIEREYALKKKEYKKQLNKQKNSDSLVASLDDLFGDKSKKSKTESNEELVAPTKKLEDIKFDSLYGSNLLEICKALVAHNTVDVQLNNRNAENEMATDLLPNSMLTNFLKQLQYTKEKEDGKIEHTGLNNLRDFIANKFQYKYSNIYYGAGSIKGLFTKSIFNTVLPTINENAANMFRIALFDGIKNNVDNDGVMYQNMSKGDYFLAKLFAFHNKLKIYDGTYDNRNNQVAGYFMRVPSDAPKNFIVQTTKYNYKKLRNNDGIININSDMFIAIRNILYGEINTALENLLIISDEEGNINQKPDKKYFENYHYVKSMYFKNTNGELELTGLVFKFIKLFNVAGIDVNSQVSDAIFLYGEADDNFSLVLRTIDENGNEILKVNTSLVQRILAEGVEGFYNQVNEIVSNWITNYENYIVEQSKEYESIYKEYFNIDDIKDCFLNYFISYSNFDDIFEGDSKFYKDAQTFLKRAKEVQAGGKSYGENLDIAINSSPVEQYNVFNEDFAPEYSFIFSEDNPYRLNKDLKISTGFKAITIYNTVRPSDNAEQIYNRLYNKFIKDGYSEEIAKKNAEEIAKRFKKDTKTNDAQSYITIEEFIRRKVLDGTFKDYEELIRRIYSMKPDENGNYNPNDLDLTGIDARILPQKNIYYDLGYDDDETGLVHPRQIKNAEFVLIPQLLPKDSGLRKLYDMMRENGIDQCNTSETSKAAKKNILTVFDNDGNFNEQVRKDIKDKRVIDTFYYRYLYKQQEVPKHLVDEKNKIAVQLLKKILDNITKDDPRYEFQQKIFEAYDANIKDSFYTFINKMGWKYYNDRIVNKNYDEINPDSDENKKGLDLTEFYKSGKYEAQRLGLDSNILDYFTLDENNNPIMPNLMSNVSTKLESIAQSMFNSGIRRQKLSGWHAAQITNVGYNKKLKFHPEIKDKDGKVIQKAYAEVLIPRWSNIIPKDYPIEKLEEEGIDIQLGYRIPTEGKQSVSILKVVGFLPDVYDSTIMVPDEWVTQTGSDFDIDSVYGICYNLKSIKDKDGNIKIIIDKPDLEDSVDATYRRYERYIKDNLRKVATKEELNELKELKDKDLRYSFYKELAIKYNLYTLGEFGNLTIVEQNTREQKENIMIENMIKIMENENSLEENLLCSNFDDITDAKEELENIRNKANGISLQSKSAYNPFDQIEFMGNATSGMTLKANSVTRDTFCSVSNKGHGVIQNPIEIILPNDEKIYNYEQILKSYGKENVELINDGKNIKIRLDRLGWSEDNHNIVGKIITAYSSQTTAHILDAIKEGTLYNENVYTFPIFKTLVDIGLDYKTAIAFLMSPGITLINDAYYETNSQFVKGYGNPIDMAIKKLARKLGLKDAKKTLQKGKTEDSLLFDEYSNTNDALNAILDYREEGTESVLDIISNIIGKLLTKESILDERFTINQELLINRLEKQTYDNSINSVAQDLITILTFKNIKSDADKLGKIISCTNPDKFGAKQTIKETRRTLNKINELANPKFKNSTGNIITSNEVPFIKALYGENSFYPYLNSFVRLVTGLSVDINSQIFTLENEVFNDLCNKLETSIGRELTEEEYKKYKNYLMNTFYNQIDIINTPLTIDEKGFIIRDQDRITNLFNSTETYSVELKEKFRICGYNITDNINFELKDFNNPSKEEINKFNSLTPVQKVLWIQKNFKNNSGVFNKLKVNLFNQYEYKAKGYSKGTISYIDDGKDTDLLINELLNTFNSKHPFIKLATIDLIKYAFVADGFKFKTGAISKIIPNDTMLNFTDGDERINIIEKLLAVVSPNNFDITKFVRANSEIVRNIKLKPNSSVLTGFNSGLLFNGLYRFDVSNLSPNAEEFFNYLSKDDKELPSFINIITKQGKQYTTTLYKLVIDDSSQILYLYPLNKLESNETTDISANITNNKYRPESYYQTVIPLLENYSVSYKDLMNDEKYKVDKENFTKELEKLNNEHKITNYEFEHIVETLEDENALLNMSEDDTNLQRKNSILNVFKQINTILDMNQSLVKLDSYYITTLFKENIGGAELGYIQNIKTNEGIKKIFIKKHNLSKLAKRALSGDKINKLKLSSEENFYVQTHTISDAFNVFEVYEVNDEKEINKLQEVAQKEVEKRVEIANENGADISELSTDDLYSSAPIINVSSLNTNTNAFSKETTILKTIIDNILYNERKEVLDEHDLFKQRTTELGLERNSLQSIYDNQYDLYKAIYKYYKSYIDRLEQKLTQFKASNGRTYNIGDAELYEHLVNTDSNDVQKVISLILQSRTLKDNISEFFNYEIETGNKETDDYIKQTKELINKVINNPNTKEALKYIFNIYFAKKYSNNPNVRDGFIQLGEIFGDTNTADNLFSDISELNNKQVQVIAKIILSRLRTAKHLSKQAIDNFNEEYERLMAESGDFNIDHIVTEDLKFIRPYTDNFIEDRKKLYEELRSIEAKYGKLSREYFVKQLEIDEWNLRNTQQKLQDSYYAEKIKNKKLLLSNNRCLELYFEYMRLNQQLNDKSAILQDYDEEIKRQQDIKQKQRILLSKYKTDDLELKSQEELDAINTLKKYFKANKETNKKYYTKKIDDAFEKQAKQYQKYIKDYDLTHPKETIIEKLQNDKYREAKEWLTLNGSYDFGENAKSLIYNAFAKLRNLNDVREKTFNRLLQLKSRTDKYGIIDGRLFTKDEIAELKREVSNSYKSFEDDDHFDSTVLKDIPESNEFYTKEFFALFENENMPVEVVQQKKALVTKINNILIKGFDKTGHLSGKLLFENCTLDELEQLGEYIKELKSYRKNLSKKQISKIKEVTKSETSPEFYKELTYYRTVINKDIRKANIWRKIFLDFHFNEEGKYVATENKETGQIANTLIYGILKPKDAYKDRFIDKEKSEAKEFIDKNIEYKNTEYYYIAQQEALDNGTYDEWFNDNHIYNPYLKKYVPLAIWTTMMPASTGELIDDYTFQPKSEFYDNHPKASALNPLYDKNDRNYKIGDNKYNNKLNLTEKEKNILSFLQRTINNVDLKGSAKQFAKEGYIPRMPNNNPDTKYLLQQALGVVGLDFRSRSKDEFYDDYGYANDREIPFGMMQLLKDKSYRKPKEIPQKYTYETEEEYKRRIEPILKENKEIDKANKKIDKLLASRDIKEIFSTFVGNSVIYEEKEKLKDLSYLLLQSIKEEDAYKINNFGTVSKGRFKTKEQQTSSTIEQKNTYDVTENFIRRVLFDQFQEKHKLRPFADFLQNMTSAKYMILNITGGIANINTGMVNILGERFARDYFGNKTFLNAERKYTQSSISFLKDMYSDTSDNFYVASAKFFDIVDIDAMLERQGSKNISDYIERARDLLYGFQSGGEHFMQNSVLFAMMESVKILPNGTETGKPKLVTLGEYIQDCHKNALLLTIEEDKDLITVFRNYLSEIATDINKKKKIDEFAINPYTDFAKRYLTKEQQDKFIAKKKEILKDAEKRFNELESVESQLDKEYHKQTGKIRIKENSLLDKNLLGQFEHKVIEVNKKIHGVYDKIGAAKIERKWFGSLVMQYHKHLYPGIMKRYRGWIGRGYYNEARGSIEVGSKVSLGRFLATEFNNIKFKDEDGNKLAVIKSIQNIFTACIDTITNFKLNYNLMPEWEQNNIRRGLADMCGVLAALGFAIALYTIFDDDEIQDDDFLATLIYLADRLHSESFMYNPLGLYTEAKTLYSSPIAATNSIQDMMQMMGIVTNYIFNEDYDIEYTSGQYAGENKLKVKLLRNIPGYRVYDRLSHMARNNSYYRIGDNNWNIKLAKTIASVTE